MKKFFALVLSVLLICSSACVFGCSKDASKASGEVSLKYLAPQAIMQGLKDGTLDYGLIAEPAATKLMGTDEWEIMDVQKLYNSETKGYPQAVFMAKNEVLEAYPQLITAIQTKFSENVGWAKENKATAVSAVQSVAEGLTTSLAPAAKLTDEAMDRCKIEWQSAQDAKASVNGYIADIRQISVGLGISSAKEVGDEFFYNHSSSVGQAMENKTFNFVVPDGAPALAIAKFISDSENFVDGATFNYKVVSADAIAGYMNGSSGLTADFMILPINAATINYKNLDEQKYTMVSVITHGNLYLISKTQSVTGLVGKKVGVMGGENKVPDLTLKVILKKNGLKYKSII